VYQWSTFIFRGGSEQTNKCQQTHYRGEFWETQLNLLTMTKSPVTFNPENDINVKLQIFNFTFLVITSISSMRICQQHQRIECRYHTPFIFLRRVASTVMFSNRVQLLTHQSFSMWFVTGHTTYYGFLFSFSKMHWCRSFNFWEKIGIALLLCAYLLTK
jgi:hypothetical protein